MLSSVLLNCKALFLYPKGVDKLAIQPKADKDKIRNRIITDPYILSLGFSSDKTYKTDTTDEKLIKDLQQIFIYNTLSRENYSNSATLETVVQVDISVPLKYDYKADLCAEQIMALMKDYDLDNGSLVDIVAPSPSVVACQSGFYCVGVRLAYCTSKYNKIKTV